MLSQQVLRPFVIILCSIGAVVESATQSYFILIQMGYSAFAVSCVLMLYFNFMDGFNVLWNHTQRLRRIAPPLLKQGGLFKRLVFLYILSALAIGCLIFGLHNYAATYFNALLFLYTHFHHMHTIFPALLNTLLWPATVISSINVYVKVVTLVDGIWNLLANLFDGLSDQHQHNNASSKLDLDYATIMRVVGYAMGASFAFTLTESSYLSLSYGFQHYHIITGNGLPPALPIPLLLITLFLSITQTCRQIVDRSIDYLISKLDAASSVSSAMSTENLSSLLNKIHLWTKNSLQPRSFIWYLNFFTYALRGYAKGLSVAVAVSLTRGRFGSQALYNFLDKSAGDPLGRVIEIFQSNTSVATFGSTNKVSSKSLRKINDDGDSEPSIKEQGEEHPPAKRIYKLSPDDPWVRSDDSYVSNPKKSTGGQGSSGGK